MCHLNKIFLYESYLFSTFSANPTNALSVLSGTQPKLYAIPTVCVTKVRKVCKVCGGAEIVLLQANLDIVTAGNSFVFQLREFAGFR